MSTIEEIEERRAERKAALEVQRLEQYAVDLEALDGFEVEHGDGRIVRVDLERFIPGLPTMVLMRLPKPIEHKRYVDQCRERNGKPGDGVAAAWLVADVCRLYPDADLYAKVKETFTGAQTNMGVAAIKACQGRADEEGKS